jgi:hypothetical protein
MARHVVNEQKEQSECETLPPCSICEGPMVLAYDRYQQKVGVCTDCNTSISIPGSAWVVAKAKRAHIPRAADRRRHFRRASDIPMQ